MCACPSPFLLTSLFPVSLSETPRALFRPSQGALPWTVQGILAHLEVWTNCCGLSDVCALLSLKVCRYGSECYLKCCILSEAHSVPLLYQDAEGKGAAAPMLLPGELAAFRAASLLLK